jgi:hypothetical protein
MGHPSERGGGKRYLERSMGENQLARRHEAGHAWRKRKPGVSA